MIYSTLKRFGDYVAAALMLGCLVLISPLLVVGNILFIDGSLVFRQVRTGLLGRPFVIYKIRTLPITGLWLSQRYSSFLRSVAVDELSQCINILRGEMSLIGPRPLLPEYLPLYSASQMRRHQLLPGVTGLSQILGRNDLSWSRKFKYDLFYVRRVDLFLDIYIIISTFRVLLRKPFGDHSSEPALQWDPES